MYILEVISLIVNILFILSLLAALGIGYLRGFWSNLRTMVGFGIGFLLLLILTGPISNGIANANIGFLDGSIVDYVVRVASDALMDGKPIIEGSDLYALCSGIASAIVKMIVIMIEIIVIVALIEPVTRIVAKAIFGPVNQEKSMGVRFGGLGLGFARFMILALTFYLPLSGVAGLAVEYKDELAKIDETGEMGLVEGFESLNKTIPNTLYKVAGKKASTKLLGSVTAIKTEGGKLNIFKEALNVKPIVSALLEEGKDFDLKDILIKHSENIATFVENTNIFENFMPVIIEILEGTNALDGKGITIEDLKAIDFSNDKKAIADAIRGIASFITEIDFENPELILGNESLPNVLKKLGEALNGTTLVEPMLNILQNVFEEASTSLGSLGETIDFTALNKNDLPNELYNLGVLANKLANTGIIGGDKTDILEDPEGLKDLIDTAFDSSLIKGQEQEVIESVLEQTGMKETLEDAGINFEFDNVDWEKEKDNIADALTAFAEAQKNIPNFDISNAVDYLKDEETSAYVTDLLKSVAKSEIINKDIIVNSVNQELANMGIDVEVSKPVNSTWEEEIDKVVEVLKYTDDMDEIINNYEQNPEKVGEILDAMSSSEMLKPVGQEVIINVIEDANVGVDMSDLDLNKVESWSQEIEALVSLKSELDNGNIDINNITEDEVKKLIDQASGENNNNYISSYIVGSAINEELQKHISEENYNQLVENYDLREPENLKDAKEEISSALYLYNNLSNLSTPEELEAADVTKICDVYASLEEDTVLNDIIVKTVVDEVGLEISEAELEKVSFTEEAVVLEEILTAYTTDASDIEILELLEKAEEETVIVKGIIDKFFK